MLPSILRKQLECLRGRQLHVYDAWNGKSEKVIFTRVGPRGGEQLILEMTRENAADLGRALVSLYDED